MRVIPSKVESRPKAGEAKPNIMDLLNNARINRGPKIKKQPRIKPRYGIFGTSMWARVRRNPLPPPPIDGPGQSLKPVSERVKARIEGNLDVLLVNHSDRNSKRLRPAESYIDLAHNKHHQRKQQSLQSKESAQREIFIGTAHTVDDVIVSGQVDRGHSSLSDNDQQALLGTNDSQKSPTVIDVTTPVPENGATVTPLNNFDVTFDSMDYNVANVFNRELPPYFKTPTDMRIFGSTSTGNSVDLIGNKFAVARPEHSGIELHGDDFNGDESPANSPMPNMNMSGWSAEPLTFGGTASFSSSSQNSSQTHYSPSYPRGGEAVTWTPSVTLGLQQLSDEIIDRIRSQTTAAMLNVIRRLNDCLLPPVCDNSSDHSNDWSTNEWQTDAGSEPATPFQPTQPTDAYSACDERGATGASIHQVLQTEFFRTNNVTIMQTMKTARIIRSAEANSFDEELNYEQSATFGFGFWF